MEEIKFPDSFSKRTHPTVPGATQWILLNDDDETIISIVGGGHGLYGDGKKTFEMYDFREGDVQGYLSTNEINKHLDENPIG